MTGNICDMMKLTNHRYARVQDDNRESLGFS
jgi:hypothetical protein